MDRSSEDFSVVIFEDNSVQVVPEKWIVDDSTCVYPNYPNDKKVLRSVESKETPKEDWKTYNITLYGSYDNLKKANKMADQAVANITESANDVEDNSGGKRIRVKKSFGPNYETEGEQTDKNDESAVSVLEIKTEQQNYKSDNRDSLIDESPISFVKTIIEEDDDNDYANGMFYAQKNEHAEPPRKMHKAYRKRVRKGGVENNGQNLNLSQQEICCKCADLVRSMSDRMTKMQQDMNTLVGLIDSATNSSASFSDAQMQKRNYHDIEYLFPVQTLQELEEVENIIETDPIRRSKIENFIKSFGGKEYDLPVSDILYNVFSNKVAVMFCYEGRNKSKLPAASLKIIQIIRDAILDTCKNSTRNIIKMKTMQWFKDAKKRLSIAENSANLRNSIAVGEKSAENKPDE